MKTIRMIGTTLVAVALSFTLYSFNVTDKITEGNNVDVTSQEISPEASYPVAEWGKATEILMHTPGDELFNGMINPLAALFEYYFDVDLAVAEHRSYISILEANGIVVHTISEILQQAPIEDLRNYVRNELKYEVSQGVKDNSAASEEYRLRTIGEMSRNDLIRCIMLRPTVSLTATDINTGLEAEYKQSPPL